jgi:Zn-finger nucleic acid-binding protein
MDDRELVKRLLEIGVEAFRKKPSLHAVPGDDENLRGVSAATLATWLAELGRHRLIGDVQPCFSSSGASFRFQVTEEAVRVWLDRGELERLLAKLVPIPQTYDIFISYAAGDAAIANELKSDLEHQGLKCFMAEKDIAVAEEWQPTIRAALTGSKRILLLLTPRSLNRPWVLMEAGGAWALGKPLIPVLSQVAPSELIDPIRSHQARVIETTAQRLALVRELATI